MRVNFQELGLNQTFAAEVTIGGETRTCLFQKAARFLATNLDDPKTLGNSWLFVDEQVMPVSP